MTHPPLTRLERQWVAQFEAGHFEKALILIHKRLRQDPDNGYTYTKLGATHLALGDFELGNASLLKAIQIDSHLPLRHANLGYAYRDQSLYAQSTRYFAQALLLLTPEQKDLAMEYSLCIGWNYYQLDQPAKAIQYLAPFAETSAAWDTYPSLAYCHLQLGNTLKAVNYYRRSLLRGSTDPKVYCKLTYCYLLLGQIPKAKETLKKSLRLHLHDEDTRLLFSYLKNF